MGATIFLADRYFLSQELRFPYCQFARDISAGLVDLARKEGPHAEANFALAARKIQFSTQFLGYCITKASSDPTYRSIWEWVITLPGQTFSEQTSKKKLSLLHIAVITLNKQISKDLLEKGVPIDSPDYLDWTPLHHAALSGNEAMIAFLLEKGASPLQENSYSGTYLDILNFTSTHIPTPEETTFLRGEDGNFLTQGDFKRLTGAEFITENKIAREDLLQNWIRPISEKTFSLRFSGEIKHKYLEFLKQPLIGCFLKTITKDSQGISIEKNIGLGVFCKEGGIPRKNIIGEYLGEVYRSNPDNPDYTLNEIDALRFRNATAMTNDGFPNAFILDMDNMRGLSKRGVLISIEDISEGSQICWNYGYLHFVKLMPSYIELRKKETREFTRDFELVNRALNALSITAPSSFEERCLIEKIAYLMATPPVLFAVIFEGAIDDGLAEDISKHSLQLFWQKYIGRSLERLLAIAKGCRKIMIKFDDIKQSNLKECYFNLMNEIRTEVNMINFLSLFEVINQIVDGMFVVLPQEKLLKQDAQDMFSVITKRIRPDIEKAKKIENSL